MFGDFSSGLVDADSPHMKLIEHACRANLEKSVTDATLHEKLEPGYRAACKRLVMSPDFYEAIQKPNAELVTEGIERVEARGVRTRDGRLHELDVLVLATGFETTEFLAPIEIHGLGGRSLRDEWKDGARAYKGISVTGFPNLFMMYGPNTNLGHNSIIFMIECQTRYILGAIRTLIRRDLAYLDVRRDVMDAADARVQRQLARTVWAATDASWYKNDAGRITNNWSGSTTRYWWLTRRFDAGRYRQRPRQRAAQQDPRRDAVSAGRAA